MFLMERVSPVPLDCPCDQITASETTCAEMPAKCDSKKQILFPSFRASSSKWASFVYSIRRKPYMRDEIVLKAP